MSEKLQPPLSRERSADAFYEVESGAREKLVSERISVKEYFVELDKICSLGENAENENKGSSASIENAFVYYKDAYERLTEVSSSVSDDAIDQKLRELRAKLESLISNAGDIGDNDLALKLQKRLK